MLYQADLFVCNYSAIGNYSVCHTTANAPSPIQKYIKIVLLCCPAYFFMWLLVGLPVFHFFSLGFLFLFFCPRRLPLASNLVTARLLNVQKASWVQTFKRKFVLIAWLVLKWKKIVIWFLCKISSLIVVAINIKLSRISHLAGWLFSCL